ncbi:glycosyltransferase family 2 protein [Niveibacterium terrae]|uniref:glycosyltransferase family 2 protein n=1 Tax=Niveibacterium terrae TaxID=3373598 RepID=UPI003A91F13A
MTPLLSICIPTYNRAPFISELLLSIENNFLDNVEVVVSDNASDDETPSIVESFIDRGMPIKYFRNDTNIGADRNFDSCVRKASGRFCWFIGSDDVMVDGSLGIILKKISENQDVDVFLVNKSDYDISLKREKKVRRALDGCDEKFDLNSDQSRLGALASGLGYIGAICIRKESWISVDASKYIGTAYIHVYILQTLIKLGRKFMYVSDSLLKWRFDNDSFLSESKALGRLDIEINYIRITRDVFGDGAILDRVGRFIMNSNILWQIVSSKLKGAFSFSMFALVFRELFWIKGSYRIFAVCLTPGFMFRIARDMKHCVVQYSNE